MASFGYNSMLRDTVTGAIDFDTDTFKVMLVGAGYTESRAHSKRSDVSSEVSGAGYTAGGAVLVPTGIDGSGALKGDAGAGGTGAAGLLTSETNGAPQDSQNFAPCGQCRAGGLWQPYRGL